MDFKISLESKKTDRLESWMDRVTSSDYSHMMKFVHGILLKASNGNIEGKMNRLKKIERDMYGRCSFGLLDRNFFSRKQPI